MIDDRARTVHSAARVGGVLLAVILVNVLLRVVPVSGVELPSVWLPDMPAWLDGVVDVGRTLVRVKNWIIGAVIVVIVAAAVIEELGKRRRAQGSGHGRDAHG